MEQIEDDLLNYESGEEDAPQTTETTTKEVKGSYAGVHSSGFRDFLLKPELMRAIVECGFEHPSEGKSVFSQMCCRRIF